MFNKLLSKGVIRCTPLLFLFITFKVNNLIIITFFYFEFPKYIFDLNNLNII